MVIELAKQGEKSLVYWGSNGQKFVVCSFFDATKPEGSMWCWGHYFSDLISAVEYFKEVTDEGKSN